MVTVEVRDADPGHGGRGHPGVGELALGPLAGIEQDAFAVPAEQIAVVSARLRRRLASRPEHHELARRHVIGLPRRRRRYGKSTFRTFRTTMVKLSPSLKCLLHRRRHVVATAELRPDVHRDGRGALLVFPGRTLECSATACARTSSRPWLP